MSGQGFLISQSSAADLQPVFSQISIPTASGAFGSAFGAGQPPPGMVRTCARRVSHFLQRVQRLGGDGRETQRWVLQGAWLFWPCQAYITDCFLKNLVVLFEQSQLTCLWCHGRAGRRHSPEKLVSRFGVESGTATHIRTGVRQPHVAGCMPHRMVARRCPLLGWSSHSHAISQQTCP